MLDDARIKDAREPQPEVLLALSLVAVMLTMIFGSFGRRAWEAADRVEDQSSIDEAQSLQQLSEARRARIRKH